MSEKQWTEEMNPEQFDKRKKSTMDNIDRILNFKNDYSLEFAFRVQRDMTL